MTKFLTISAIVAGMLLLVFGAYASWYTYMRHEKISQVAQCQYDMEHPKPPTMMTAPDGSLAPVYSVNGCPTIIVPPPLWNVIRGRVSIEGVPKHMIVNPYSPQDILFGNYSYGPNNNEPCDQSAT